MDLKMILLAVITLIVLYAVYVVVKRTMAKARIKQLIATLDKVSDARAFSMGGHLYKVWFVYEGEPEPTENNWGKFNQVDMEAIKDFIKHNPNIPILNIPNEPQLPITANPRSLYKVIRLK